MKLYQVETYRGNRVIWAETAAEAQERVIADGDWFGKGAPRVDEIPLPPRHSLVRWIPISERKPGLGEGVYWRYKGQDGAYITDKGYLKIMDDYDGDMRWITYEGLTTMASCPMDDTDEWMEIPE